MSNYCYTTLLTSDNYVQGVILLEECLRIAQTKYPFLCLITEDLSPKTFAELRRFNIQYKFIDKISMPDNLYEHNKKLNSKLADTWRDTFTKFHIWTLTEFDKVIFLDADLFILRNLDHCFEYPELTAAVDGEYFHLWQNDLFFNSGFMVIEPNIETFTGLLAFSGDIKPEEQKNYLGQPKLIADQDVLNMYFDSWKTDESRHLDKYYNVFAPYIRPHMEADLKQNCYFIHYVGLKPWQADEFVKLQITQGARSNYYYCLGAGLLECVNKAGLVTIDQNYIDTVYNQAAVIAQMTVFDYETAGRLYTAEDRKQLLTINEPLYKLLAHIYDKNITANVVFFDEILKVKLGDLAVTAKYYKFLEEAILEHLKQF